eukprot:6450715-Amphidinium_carterae.1
MPGTLGAGNRPCNLTQGGTFPPHVSPCASAGIGRQCAKGPQVPPCISHKAPPHETRCPYALHAKPLQGMH